MTNLSKKDPSEEIDEQKRIIFKELKERTNWFINLRWFVPPCIVAGAAIGRRIGFDLSLSILFSAAAFILVYNAVFDFKRRRQPEAVDAQRAYVRTLARWQFGLDYCAMFLLIHVTGGISSPLIYFFIFHINV